MDENKEVNTTDPKREKVRVIPLSAIDDAPDHPFQVRDDDEMAELVESISTFGVMLLPEMILCLMCMLLKIKFRVITIK